MSSKARAVIVASVIVTLTVLPPGTPPALAFTEGSSNNFFGTGAGNSIDTGADNSFFGGNAGFSTSSGNNNSFFGFGAGFVNTTGFANAFFGKNAGFFNTTGGGNAALGWEAGAFNTTGADNAFFGLSAGVSNTSENNNSFIGAGSNGVAAITNATAVGNRAQVSQSDSLVLGSIAGVNGAGDSVQVGIGTTSPSQVLHLRTTDGDGARTRYQSDLFGQTWEAGGVFGEFGVRDVTGGGVIPFHVLPGSQGDLLVLNGTRIGIGTSTPGNALHILRGDGTAKVFVQEGSETPLGRSLFQLTNNGAARFRIQNSDNGATWDFQTSGGGGSFVIDRVGGPASLDFEIQPDGDAVHLGTVTAAGFITSSDRNLKTDITPAKASKLMALLRQLDISSWRFKDQAKGTNNLGPMAQDFHRLFGLGTDTTIDVRDLAALALVAAQALDDEVAQQEKVNIAQREVNQELRTEMDELRETVANLSS